MSKHYSLIYLLLLIFSVNSSSIILKKTILSSIASYLPFIILHPASFLATDDSILCRSDTASLTRVGAGGSGEVFLLPNSHTNKLSFVLKKSGASNQYGVAHECEVLNRLASSSINHIEQCLCSSEVNGRQIEVLAPFFLKEAPRSDFSLISDKSIRGKAIRDFIETNVQILYSNIALSDVQFLLDEATGDFLVIDLSEAVYLSSSGTFDDTSRALSYLSEMMTCIPEEDEDIARNAAMGVQPNRGAYNYVKEVVRAFFSPDTD